MKQRITAASFALLLALTPASAFARSRGKTPTFLDVFQQDQMTCGSPGWTFPVLLGGHIPVSACILKFRNNVGSSPFGPL